MRKYRQKYSIRGLALIIGVVGMMGASHASGASDPQMQGPAGSSPQAARASKKQGPIQQMYGLVRNGDWDAVRALFRSLNTGPDAQLRTELEKFLGEADKMQFASRVIRLGFKNKDEEYFQYLAERAKVAIEREVPFPLKFDEKGKWVRGEMSEAFLNWCAKHQVEPGEMAKTLLQKDLVPVMALAYLGDPRALPLLLRGLASPNLYVVKQAANGLGLIGDARAITPIVEAIEKVPEEVRELFASELGYFAHPKAHAALARFIQDPQKRQQYIASTRAELAKRKKSREIILGDAAPASQPSQGTVGSNPPAKRALKKQNPMNQMRELIRKRDWDGIRTLFDWLDDGEGKMKVASKALRLGRKEKDEAYFRYLAELAQVAIERDVPSPMTFDEQGNWVRGKVNEAFLAWCTQHKVKAGEIAPILAYKDPMRVKLLADPGDPRALPLLLRGLTSPNFHIRLRAAHGVGLIGEARAIAPLIQAIEKTPKRFKKEMAKELGYFDHPQVQAALERFLEDPQKRQRAIASARADLAKRKKSRENILGDTATAP